MADIFISYAADDRAWVEHFAQALSDQGWSVWWDRSIPFGQSYQTVIEQALRDAACVFVVWSVHSINSSWVWAEAEEARNRNILIPVVIDGSQPPLVFRQIQTADLSQWQTEPPVPLDAKLLRDLEGLIGRPASIQTIQSEAPPQSQPRRAPVADKIEAKGKTQKESIADTPQPIKTERQVQQSTTPQTTVSRPEKRSLSVYLVGFLALLFLVIAILFLVNNDQPQTPKIHDFSVQPQTIDAGDLITLNWSTENASQVELKGFGYLAHTGSKSVRPEKTTVYTLVISSPEGLSIQREVEVFVNSTSALDSKQQAINELLMAARQAISVRDFAKAEALINELKTIAPDSQEVKQALDYFASEGVNELLRLARQAIKARDFSTAKELLVEAEKSAPGDANIQQVIDYYRSSKTLYDQQVAAETKLKALKEAERKAALEARRKEASADKIRLQQEAETRQQAYELQQRQLDEIKAQQEREQALREQEMAAAEALLSGQQEDMTDKELRERRDKNKETLRDFFKLIR